MPYAGGDEQDVINRLREAGALSVSLVATIDDEIVGHVAFSPADAADSTGPWFTLGPVSVLPDYQRQGIGSALIRQGLDDLEALGALGCVLVGNPEYYQRFGFELAPATAPQDDYRDVFMIYCFSTGRPGSTIEFHPAFYAGS